MNAYKPFIAVVLLVVSVALIEGGSVPTPPKSNRAGSYTVHCSTPNSVITKIYWDEDDIFMGKLKVGCTETEFNIYEDSKYVNPIVKSDFTQTVYCGSQSFIGTLGITIGDDGNIDFFQGTCYEARMQARITGYKKPSKEDFGGYYVALTPGYVIQTITLYHPTNSDKYALVAGSGLLVKTLEIGEETYPDE